MNTDEAMRARNAGKDRSAASVVWQLRAGAVHLRCRGCDATELPEGYYEVQALVEGRWKRLYATRDNPYTLLNGAVCARSVRQATEGKGFRDD